MSRLSTHSADAAAPQPAREGVRQLGGPWRALLIAAAFGHAPFVAFLADNAGGPLRPWDVLRYPAAVTVAAACLLAVLWWWRGHVAAERLALVFAAAVVATFNYRNLSLPLEAAGLRTLLRMGLWALLALTLVLAAAYWSRHATVRRYATLAGAVLVLVPAVQLLAAGLSASPTATVAAPAAQPGTLAQRPDIYYVIPDGYGRADVLAEHLGYDSGPFLDDLRNRGFVVVPQATVNYPMTYLSVSSTLDMDYLLEPGPEALDGTRGPYYHRLQGGSVVHERLRAEGYRYVQAPPGTWSGSACSGVEDLCVEPLSRRSATGWLGEAEWALLQLTPAGHIAEQVLTQWLERPFADPGHVARTVRDADIGAPVYAQIHMLQPHPPFLFDAQCRSMPQDDHRLTDFRPEHTAEYMEALECTNRKLLELIDTVPRDAVVVILADHGPGFGIRWSLPFDEWSEAIVRERFTVLSALRLPVECRDDVPDDLSAVNVFRVVLACLEGRDPEMLPNRWLLSSHSQSELRELDNLPTNKRPAATRPLAWPGSHRLQ